MEKNEVLFDMAPQPPYSCILDGVQYVQVQNALITQAASQASLRESMQSRTSAEAPPQLLTLKFHYTRRMAGIIQEEDEIARARYEEKER